MFLRLRSAKCDRRPERRVDFAECDESFKSESFCDEKDELCWSKAGSTASVDSGYNWLLDSDFGENNDSSTIDFLTNFENIGCMPIIAL
ncbi:unnamed protein product [Bemisia tabaci]|uniref:Uncharacterized protein n=1 Tax=Bemisia tabaci TaxID=7038 RepID=A0A9P0A2U8_BEMTA|nr:unnamed protein product [Bemisia tabaci]